MLRRARAGLELARRFAAAVLCVACSDSGQVLGPAAMGPTPALGTSVSAGDGHACAVSAGVVSCWGANDQGQLGSGDTQPRLQPVFSASSRKFRRVSAGANHTCALTEANEVYCWGGNDRGQLGVGSRIASSRPLLVSLPKAAVQLSADFTHSCAVLDSGDLYCWGENFEGQLGQGDFPPDVNNGADLLSPTLVPGGPYQYVDTGQGHTCAVKRDGTLWCWGRNTDRETSSSSEVQLRTPQQVGNDSDWLSVDAGQSHTCGLRVDRSAWCWGRNTGQEGDDGYPLGIPGASLVESPERVDSSTPWLTLSTDTFHTCALDAKHDLWCWGRNQEGQLGLDDTTSRPTPVLVRSGVTSTDAGRFFGCIADVAGGVLCAGANESGQLGTGDTVRKAVFTAVAE